MGKFYKWKKHNVNIIKEREGEKNMGDINVEVKEILGKIDNSLKLLVLANRQNIEKERNGFLDTGGNRKILNLCNGKREIKEIARRAGKTKRMVQYVVDQLVAYGFVALTKASSGKAKLPKKL